MRRFSRLAGAFLIAALADCGGSSPTSPGSAPPSDCPAGAPVPGTPGLVATLVASGLQSPTDVQWAPGDRARFFVVEQAGRIRVVRGGSLASLPFLDITARVASGGERGLLGLAFHPQFTANGRFYVNYTDRGGDTHVSEFRTGASPDLADAASERELLFVRQPFANHNGGGLAFGPDGMLYIGLGDGGSGGDPLGNGQSLATRLGKLLRVDANVVPFGIPADNPFVARAGALPEIWAYGLRNPWRFSFDRATGDLYIGDVGQDAYEEIDVGLAARHGGENYGWNVMEGTHCYSPRTGCDPSGLTLPVLDYPHAEGFSVTGGVVYRGCRMPGYQGRYFYGDYGRGFVRSFRLVNGAVSEARDWSSAFSGSIRNPVAFAVDPDGEMYVLDYGGSVYRIDPSH